MTEYRNDYDTIAKNLADALNQILRNAHEPRADWSDSITITKDGYITGIVRLARLQAWVEGLAITHRIYAKRNEEAEPKGVPENHRQHTTGELDGCLNL